MVYRVPTQQYSFTSGMLDPDLAARGDIRAYYAGGKEILNMLGLPQGGLDMRGGLRMAAELPEASTGCRLARFEFSTEQVYLIVFTDQEARVYLSGVLQFTIATPYTAADLSAMDWTQSLDTMILVHPDHAPRKLVRQGAHDQWGMDTLTFTNIPQYEFGKIYPSVSGTPAAVSGSGITFTVSADLFASGDVGATIEGNGGVCTIATYVSATEVTVNITTAFTDTSEIAAAAWSFDMSTATTAEEDTWSDRRGWPRSVFLFQGRLYFGGSRARPQTLWGSTSNNFFDFETTTDALDDESVELTLDDDRVSAIQKIYALDDLFLFTTGGVYVVDETPITPSNFYALRHAEMPAANLRPSEIEGSICFAKLGDDGAHQSIHELVYDDAKQVYTTQDLSLLSGTLMRAPVDMAMRLGNESNSANHLFVVNGADGTVAVLNTRRSQQITGWTLCDTTGTFLNVAVVGNTAYFMVKRTIAETDRWFIERLDKDCQLDCSVLQTSEAKKATWDGLDIFDGHTVAILADGAYAGDFTVVGGEITLDYDVSEVEAGLPFDWTVETMPIEAQLTDGTLIGNRHRLTKITVRVRETVALTVNGRPVAFRKFSGPVLDAAPPAFTGTVTARQLGWTGGRGGEGATARMAGRSTARGTILSATVEVAQ